MLVARDEGYALQLIGIAVRWKTACHPEGTRFVMRAGPRRREGEDRSRYAHTQFHEHQRPQNRGSYPGKEERPVPERPRRIKPSRSFVSRPHGSFHSGRRVVMDRTVFVLPVLWQGGAELRHVGVYPLYTVVAVHRDAVVAIQNELVFVNLVQAHRRELLAPVEGPVHVLPLRPRALP